MDDLELVFLGTGTSAGIPMIGCHCPVCSSSNPHDSRTRPSALVCSGESAVLIDTTPELRLQCLANRIDRVDAVVYTHAHADHIMGLDDLRRFNALSGNPLDVWATEATHAAISRCFGYAFCEPPADSKVFRPHLVRRIITGDFQIAGRVWKPIPLWHGEMPVLGFRIGNLAYCTDVNQIPADSYELLQGLDVLVLDALQYKSHTTHFSLDEAVAQSMKIGARRTFFTHIAHALGHDATNARLPENIRLAHDGLRVRVG